MRSHRRALACLALTLGAACNDPGTREQLTVVVAADRARARADQERLREMQESLAQAKQELVDTRADLQALRQKLLATGALTADEMKKLDERERALEKREASLPAAAPAASTTTTLTRADVEQLLRAQEERLRTLLASAPAAAAAAAPPAPAAGSERERDEVMTQLAAVEQLRSQRGLRSDDVEGGPALERRINEALRARRYAAAGDDVRELRRKTEATKVDGAFIKRKYSRANASLGVLKAEQQERAKRLLGDAVARNNKGDAAGANEALNAVLDLR